MLVGTRLPRLDSEQIEKLIFRDAAALLNL
jgi:hypothetical protein